MVFGRIYYGEVAQLQVFASGRAIVLPSRQFLLGLGTALAEILRLPMTTRIRLLITAVLVCHLLLAPRLVTSQLLPAKKQAKSTAPANTNHQRPSRYGAEHQEKDGEVYRLNGNVKIDLMAFTPFLEMRRLTTQIPATYLPKAICCSRADPTMSTSKQAAATYNIEHETGKFARDRSIGLKVHKGAGIPPVPTHSSLLGESSKRRDPTITSSSTAR